MPGRRPYILDSPAARSFSRRRSLGGLIGCVLLVALAYLGAVRVAERTVRSDRSLVPEFIQGLVPIALVYAVAHYFTLLVIQAQYAFPLASDPFGFGWNLFGTPGLRAEQSHRSRRSPSGGSRSARSSPATPPAWLSRTTAPSRSCPPATLSVPSTRCWG